jgi:hypothetical protein
MNGIKMPVNRRSNPDLRFNLSDLNLELKSRPLHIFKYSTGENIVFFKKRFGLENKKKLFDF